MVIVPQSGPFNLELNNAAAFVIEFLDINGLITTPTAPVMTVSYIDNTYTPRIDTVALIQNGSFFNGTWSSSLSNLGLATWLVTSLSSVQVSTGQIRVIQRKGG